MSYKIVEDLSMLFDDSKVAIIPVNSEFNPISKEGEIYTSIYKSGYKKCKSAFLLGRFPKKCYCSRIGKGRYVFYLVDIEMNYNYLVEISSLLSRFLNNNESISILVDKIPRSDLDNICKDLISNLKGFHNIKVYYKALAC